MKPLLLVLLLLPLVAGCDAIQQKLGIQDPARLAAEGKAIGSACRHAGRGLEDCYKLNPKVPKAAVFDGWKEMNEYMLKNNMEAVAPQLSPDTHPAKPDAAPEPAKPDAAPAPQDKAAEKPAEAKKPVEPKKEDPKH
jgi:hypothetical protein